MGWKSAYRCALDKHVFRLCARHILLAFLSLMCFPSFLFLFTPPFFFGTFLVGNIFAFLGQVQEWPKANKGLSVFMISLPNINK